MHKSMLMSYFGSYRHFPEGGCLGYPARSLEDSFLNGPRPFRHFELEYFMEKEVYGV